MNLYQIHRLTGTATFEIFYDESYHMAKVEWSDNLRYLLGYTNTYDFPDDIKSVLYSLHHEDYKVKEKLMKFAGMTGKLEVDFNAPTRKLEFRLRKKNNEYMWLRGEGGFFPSGDSHYSCCIGGLLTDITHEKETASRELQARNELSVIEEVSMMADIGIWEWTIKDGYRNFLNGNRPYRKFILGDDSENIDPELLFRRWWAGLGEEDIQVITKEAQKMKMGIPVQFIYTWNHPTKGKRIIRTYGMSHYDKEKGVVSRGYFVDITETVQKANEDKEKTEKLNRELEEALKLAESANEAKTIFLNNMSHDIRTPMNAILGFAELMGKNYGNRALFDDYLSKIKSSGHYLLSLINDVLDMARIDSGKTVVDEELVDVCDKDMNVISMFTSLIEKKNLHLTMVQDIKHRYVYLDPGKVHQIIINLVSNAIKYTPEGGNINLQFVEEPCGEEGYAYYKVVVADSGIGMSKEFVEHIFDNFSRERTTTESKVVGTGLGMSISKKLCDLMGGTLDVETELGKGTTFTLTLKHRYVEEMGKEAEDNTQDAEDISLEGKRVLLTEDNEINAEIAEALLSECGLLIDRAEDGVDCINKLSASPAGYYDLILMDILMPNMNGYDASRKIRAMEDKEKARIPIIAMTANAFDEDRKKALAAGMNEHLPKPIEVERTLKTIVKILGTTNS